ncbi:hypothetical protein CEXT_399751 [Caerostris extrusa]|uniref:Uncharacterized protein n=1 Tax=Caerostris extrusa TaxID=172846 RepID=A0AAV4XCU9_CAEEX|nr:hypothetical protein CEXT_399751 [Caerostris extrusa]
MPAVSLLPQISLAKRDRRINKVYIKCSLMSRNGNRIRRRLSKPRLDFDFKMILGRPPVRLTSRLKFECRQALPDIRQGKVCSGHCCLELKCERLWT